jgi:hypothetical protein
VNLSSCLNEVLQVGASEEVAEVHKLAMVRVLDVDDTPPVPAASDGLAVNYDVILRADNGKRNDGLLTRVNDLNGLRGEEMTYPN